MLDASKLPQPIQATPLHVLLDGSTAAGPKNTNSDTNTILPEEQTLLNKLPDKPVSSNEALTAMFQSDGDLMLAAVRLRTKPHNVMAAIVQDQANKDMLASWMRTFASVKMIETIGKVHLKIQEALDSEALSARDLSRTYVSLMEAFSRMSEADAASANTNNNITPIDAAMRGLPDHVRGALHTLALASEAS